MQEYIVEAKGVKTRVVEWGDKEKPVVLCLHGLGTTSMNFIEIAEILKDEYRLIAIDLPGHGKTDIFHDPKDYHFPNLAKWLDLVVDQLKIKDFYLIGHSWGANISLFFIAEFALKVNKMILLDGGYFLNKTAYEYDSQHDNLIWEGKSYEEKLQAVIDWRYKVYDGCRYTDLNKFIEDEKEDYPRWSPLLSKAHLDVAVNDNGIYKFHVKGSTAEIIVGAFYDFQPDLVYQIIRNNNIFPKILLLFSEKFTDDENLLKLTDNMLNKFQNETGSTVKKLPLGHMMHWENPEMIVTEICNWFK